MPFKSAERSIQRTAGNQPGNVSTQTGCWNNMFRFTAGWPIFPAPPVSLEAIRNDVGESKPHRSGNARVAGNREPEARMGNALLKLSGCDPVPISRLAYSILQTLESRKPMVACLLAGGQAARPGPSMR